jgi:MraZ protein
MPMEWWKVQRRAQMSQFFGNHQNRLDAKRRVSVPAAFRAVLKSDVETIQLILRPSHAKDWRCIEAWTKPAYAVWESKLEQYEHFSMEREALATVIYTGAITVETDKEGRIMIPEELAEFANLKESGPVSFMGRGPIFHIWEPQAGAAFIAEMRAQAAALTPMAGRA